MSTNELGNLFRSTLLGVLASTVGLLTACAHTNFFEHESLLTFAPITEHLDEPAREPMVIQLSDGTLFVTGYLGGGQQKVPLLWTSNDSGASWRRVDVGAEAQGAVGNSDVDLTVAPDGTLYFAAMSFDGMNWEGTGMAVGVGRNQGRDWTWTSISKTRFDDRPWIKVTPDGTVHMIWNDGEGVRYVVSTDQGRSWKERPRILSRGHSSHFAVGPAGEMAVRITPISASGNRKHEGTDLIAVSIDQGQSWQLHTPPGTRTWPTFIEVAPDGTKHFTLSNFGAGDVFRWVEPIAWDAAGDLFYAWSEGTTLWLARSKDRGRTWAHWPVAEHKTQVYFPYLVANEAGQLAATWYSGGPYPGTGTPLKAHVALITLSRDTTSAPQVAMAEPFLFNYSRKNQEGIVEQDSAGEYFPVLFLKDGRLAAVTPLLSPDGARKGFTWRPIVFRE